MKYIAYSILAIAFGMIGGCSVSMFNDNSPPHVETHMEHAIGHVETKIKAEAPK